MNKIVPIALALLVLGFAASAVPVQATTYEVTMRLTKDGTTTWNASVSVTPVGGIAYLKVPIGVYNELLQWWENVTYGPTDFSLFYVDPITHKTTYLYVTSQPKGLNVIFVVLSLGDVNGDGKVNFDDLFLLLRGYGTSRGMLEYNPYADLNVDGIIDYNDLFDLLRNYGG